MNNWIKIPNLHSSACYSRPIYFVTSSGSPGGAERQLANLLNNLTHNSINLLVLNNSAFLESLISNNNVSITYLRSNNILLALFAFCRRLRVEPDSNITIVGWMAKANIFVLFASLLLLPFKSTSLIWNHRSNFFLYQSVYSQLLLFSSLFFSFLSPKKITHVSNSSSIFSHKLVRSMLTGPKYVIPNGFEFSSFPSFNKTRQLSIPLPFDGKLLLICPARLSPEKGHQLLFQALERVNFNFHITLVGTGCNYENPSLLSLISKVRDNVSLIEHSSSILDLYCRHHYTVLFSSSESFPNVIVESMALSVPTICSDVGESKSIVGPYGFVLKERTVVEACESLCSAYRLCLSRAYSDMCINARNHVVDKYSVSKMTKAFNTLF